MITPKGEAMTIWEPMASAPKDGTRIDLVAKLWRAEVDDFIYRRFPDCYWTKGDSMTNRHAYWVNLDTGYHPTHWAPVPALPSPPHRGRRAPMSDPTYDKSKIDANPVWKLAFRLSEFDNDNAPIGWHRYTLLAQWLLNNFDMTEKPKRPEASACRWADDDDGVYGTTCGHAFQFNDEGPRLNGFKWCPYCGARLEEVEADSTSPPTEAGERR